MKDVTRQQVKQLMSENALYRNDDKALLIKVWSLHGVQLNSGQIDKIRRAPSPDTILRRRREFSKLYPADPVVTAHRHRQEDRFVEEYSDGNWFKRLMNRRGL